MEKVEFKNDEKFDKDFPKSWTFSECPPGWRGLVYKLFEDIRDVCNKYQSALPRVVQIKSKFGELSFNLDSGYPLFDGKSPVGVKVMRLIHDAEIKSISICEFTGLPGSPHVKEGWYATLSEKKAEELGYKKVKPMPN